MERIYESLIEACKVSKIAMIDINPEYFFGNLVPSPIPFTEGDILDYITSLTDGFLESENKLVVLNNRVTKLDIALQDLMIDEENIECYPYAVLDSFEELCKVYVIKGQKDKVYIVSKDYDAEENKTTYCLSQLVKLK